MDEINQDFNPAEFNPWEASDELCWKVLPQLEGRERAETLHALGRNAFVRGDYQAALLFADEAADVLARLGDDMGVGLSLMNTARSARNCGAIEDAVDRFRRAAAVLTEAGAFTPASDAMLQAAPLLNDLGHRQESRSAYKDAMELALSSGDEAAHADAANKYACSLVEGHNPREAKKILLSVMDVEAGTLDIGLMAKLTTTLAEAELALNNDEVALKLINESRDYSKAMHDSYDYCRRTYIACTILLDLGRADEAEVLLEEISSLSAHEDKSTLMQKILGLQAVTALELCQFDEAYDFARSAISFATIANDIESLKWLRVRAIQACIGDGKYDEAISHYRDWQQEIKRGEPETRYNQHSANTPILEAFMQSQFELNRHPKQFEVDYNAVAQLITNRATSSTEEMELLDVDCAHSIARLIRTKGVVDWEITTSMVVAFEAYKTAMTKRRKAEFHMEMARHGVDLYINVPMAMKYFIETDQLDRAKRASELLDSIAQDETEAAKQRQLNDQALTRVTDSAA